MQQYWIWLAQHTALKGYEKRTLLEHFSSPEDLYALDPRQLPEDLVHLAPLVKKLKDKDLTETNKILARCREKEIRILTFGDPEYPGRLRQIADAPAVLYCKGQMPDLNRLPVIGVVGTRKATSYGLNTARLFGGQIAACGALVISGGAAGVDAEAMAGALEAGCPTVGVLGCGVDVVYPKSNRALFSEILQKGCLLSEYPPESPPLQWHFPQRNRIISGIANGILVVKAPEKSGALITARLALDQGRDVYVVPGNIDSPLCAGSNALLSDRAVAACSGWDTVKEYTALYPGILSKREPVRKKVNYTLSMLAETELEPELPEASKPVAGKKTPGKKQKILPETQKIVDKKPQDSYSIPEEKLAGLSEVERAVALALKPEPQSADELVAAVEYPCAKVLSTLTLLILKGIAQNHPGNRVSLKTE